MNRPRLVGILGGTFDPIHLGHLGAAEAARIALGLDEVLIVPVNVPPHRQNGTDASGYHRFAMVALAVASRPGLAASDVELLREGPSYSAATLRVLHARGLDARQLFFITGADAFAEIATWREYPGLIDLANFVVIARPGFSIPSVRSRLPDLAPRMRTVRPGSRWRRTGSGSGTAIFLVEAETPDVSSTLIRDRIHESGPLSGLVPPEVERHIYRHGLYAPGHGSLSDAFSGPEA